MRKSRLSLIIAGVILLSFGIAYGQPLSNEQIVISSVKAAVDSEVTGDSTHTLQITVKAAELDRLVGDGLYDGLRDKYGKAIYLSSLDPQLLSLNYDILGFDFSYKKGQSRGFFKSHKIARDFRCQLRININGGPDSKLILSQGISVSYHDEIEPSDLNYVKSRRIPELAPSAPGSGWSRYAEPSLVIASVGTLVYLFFANR